MVGDTAENIGQPSLRIDAIELGCFNERICNGRRLAAGVGASRAGYQLLTAISFLSVFQPFNFRGHLRYEPHAIPFCFTLQQPDRFMGF